jgi:DNA-binding GntR family transcriptional regulator
VVRGAGKVTALRRIEGRSTFVPQVYDELRRAILGGVLAPGTRLIESRLASELGVSRTPLREAISRLVAQGFVRERDGVRVVADMKVELHEIFAIRQVLEGLSASLAARQATDEELAEIESVCDRSMAALSANSVAERASFNAIFHGAIAKASHSERLIKLIKECYEYVITEEMLPFYSQEITREHLEQHAGIVRALKARDAAAAESAMKRHVADVEMAIDRALRLVEESGLSHPASQTMSKIARTVLSLLP